jgi:hypothetical protein
MSRPCTDFPITRVSVTNDGATVVEVVVDDDDFVVGASVVVGTVVVVGSSVEVVVGAGVDVVARVVASGVVVDCVCEVDEQANAT